MKKAAMFVSICLLMTCTGGKPKSDMVDDPAMALIERIVGESARQFEIEYIEKADDKDVFELASKDGKIVLRGNDGVSVASALNHYLKHYCQVEISWNTPKVTLPKELPEVKEKVRKVSPYRYRYYLNYCTFNYTMAW
jgi:alpha-N-acetylglucosaminidase